MNLISWLNRKLEGDKPESNQVVAAKLAVRCNAEIVARILRRAEIHEAHGGYLARCSVLDTQAAGRIMNLERKLALAENRCASEFEREVERMLRVLREP